MSLFFGELFLSRERNGEWVDVKRDNLIIFYVDSIKKGLLGSVARMARREIATKF